MVSVLSSTLCQMFHEGWGEIMWGVMDIPNDVLGMPAWKGPLTEHMICGDMETGLPMRQAPRQFGRDTSPLADGVS
jgi:hypothetical protein